MAAAAPTAKRINLESSNHMKAQEQVSGDRMRKEAERKIVLANLGVRARRLSHTTSSMSRGSPRSLILLLFILFYRWRAGLLIVARGGLFVLRGRTIRHACSPPRKISQDTQQGDWYSNPGAKGALYTGICSTGTKSGIGAVGRWEQRNGDSMNCENQLEIPCLQTENEAELRI